MGKTLCLEAGEKGLVNPETAASLTFELGRRLRGRSAHPCAAEEEGPLFPYLAGYQ